MGNCSKISHLNRDAPMNSQTGKALFHVCICCVYKKSLMNKMLQTPQFQESFCVIGSDFGGGTMLHKDTFLDPDLDLIENPNLVIFFVSTPVTTPNGQDRL